MGSPPRGLPARVDKRRQHQVTGMRARTDRRSLETMDLNAIGSHQTHRGHVTGSSGVESRMRVRVVSALIHAAANFASFLRLRELSINESTFCRMVWKEQRLCR